MLEGDDWVDHYCVGCGNGCDCTAESEEDCMQCEVCQYPELDEEINHEREHGIPYFKPYAEVGVDHYTKATIFITFPYGQTIELKANSLRYEFKILPEKIEPEALDNPELVDYSAMLKPGVPFDITFRIDLTEEGKEALRELLKDDQRGTDGTGLEPVVQPELLGK